MNIVLDEAEILLMLNHRAAKMLKTAKESFNSGGTEYVPPVAIFSIGDHVRVKNDKNSPTMTVEKVEKYPNSAEGFCCECTWFSTATNGYKHEAFNQNVLELVKAEEVKKLPASEQNKLNYAKNAVIAYHNLILDMEKESPNSRIKLSNSTNKLGDIRGREK